MSNTLKLIFLSGLPRSGSTWLGAILNQNPQFYVTTQSPFVELLWRNFSLWDDDKWKADLENERLQDIRNPYLQKLTELYYSQLTDKSIVIDTQRAWHSVQNIEMFIKIFGVTPKIICPVRKVEEIIASFIELYKRNDREWDYDTNMRGNIFENPYVWLRNTHTSSYKDILHLVDYQDLVDFPNTVLHGIYDFIEEPKYGHDLNSVVANESYKTVDVEYNLVGLHEIKSGITKSNTQARKILTEEQFLHFQKWTFWKGLA